MKLFQIYEARYYGEHDEVECPECFGKGKEPLMGRTVEDGYSWTDCHECGGSGKIPQHRRNNIRAKNDRIVQSSKNLR